VAKTDWKDIDGTVASVTEIPSRGGTIYEVIFTYEVDGHWCGGTYSSYEAYRKGDTIAVRYDPRDPDRNDLSEKQEHQRWIFIAIAVVVVVAGILFFVFSR
jgi:hypothetical protein